MKTYHLAGSNMIVTVGGSLLIFGFLFSSLLDRLSLSIKNTSKIANVLASLAVAMILYGVVGKIVHYDYVELSFIIGALLFVAYYIFYAQRSDLRKLELRSDRQLACILFTDIVGYTAMMGDNEANALKVLERNRKIQKPIIEMYQGKWLKEMGDGTLSIFFTASDAVLCAIDIMEKVRQEGSFRLRMGIHLGEIVFSGKDIFGDGVNVASRIMDEAKEGGICISEAVYHNIKNKENIKTKMLGDIELKNVTGKMRLYKIENAALNLHSR
ncbi:MAG: adenylate/guanylate cyclase domain-containing protein [Bacteroidota bacterium]